MRKRIYILPIVLAMLSVGGVRASDDALDVDTITDEELVEIYDDTMQTAADTRARVEEILAPVRPSNNLWVDADPEKMLNVTTGIVLPQELFDLWKQMLMRQKLGDCPFDTVEECKIWRSKPTIRESIIPTDPELRDYTMADISATIDVTGNLDTNSPVAAPLIARYKALMRVSNACCTDGIVYALRHAGASDGLVYKFMVDDANFYGVGERCLMMTDKNLEAKFPEEPSTVATVSDVRNRCLCQSKQQFYDILAPFTAVWDANPEFAEKPFTWTYTDGLNRNVIVSINRDVQNVLDQLAQCP